MNEFDLVNLLMEKNYHITTAESCTGGLVSASIVNVPDASKVLKEAYVTYAAESKTAILGVDPKTIEKYNVVSEEVAKEMAFGAKLRANADVAISITGMAGPSSDGIIEVGTVCFGVVTNSTYKTVTKKFGNLGRNVVRAKAVIFAIEFAYQVLKDE